MSLYHVKRPPSPCLTSGCGDVPRYQLGLERKQHIDAYLRNSNQKINRRDVHKVPVGTIKRTGSCSKIAIPKCTTNGRIRVKKASSLEDLSPKREEVPRRRKRLIQMPIINSKNIIQDEESQIDVTYAARRICQVLMLNAWRCKRRDSKQLTKTIEQLGMQVDNLNIQTIVLKKLLESEKERVSKAAEEVQSMAAQVETSKKERDAVKAEKEEVEREVSRLENSVFEANTRCQNLKNDFFTARSEVAALENQIHKERDKLAKLREDKKHLIEKVQLSEETLANKTAAIERLNNLIAELKNQLQTQEILSNAAQTANLALKQLEKDQSKLAEDLKDMQSLSEQLKVRIQILEDQLLERDQQKGELERAVRDQQIEITRLRKEIVDYSEMQNTWSARALRLLTSMARFPVSIFSSLALLLTPFPPSGP